MCGEGPAWASGPGRPRTREKGSRPLRRLGCRLLWGLVEEGQAEGQAGDALPRLGGTPGHPCAEPAPDQQNRPPPGAQEREVSPTSVPLLGTTKTKQDSLQRQRGPGGRDSCQGSGVPPGQGPGIRILTLCSSQGAGLRQGGRERAWGSCQGPGPAGSWFPEAPGPDCPHTLHAAFRGKPGGLENQLEGTLSWMGKLRPGEESAWSDANHSTNTARAHGAPG